MNPSEAGCAPDITTLEQWRRETAARIPFVDDVWSDPANEGLLRAVRNGSEASVLKALFALGVARQHQRFSLCEALEDLVGLSTVLSGEEAARIDRLEFALHLAEGWDSCAPSHNQSMRDPLSFLPNAEYFRLRVAEIYEDVERPSSSLDTHVLVTARVIVNGSLVERLAARIALGERISKQFMGLPRALDDHIALVAMPRSWKGLEASSLLTGLNGVHVTEYPFPTEVHELNELLDVILDERN